MAKKNRTCICCSKQYSYCNTCSHDTSKPSWMNVYCSENCRTLVQTATNYNMGFIGKETSRERLKNVDITNISKYKPDIQKFINAITENTIEKSEDNSQTNKTNQINIDNTNDNIKKDETGKVELVVPVKQTETLESVNSVEFVNSTEQEELTDKQYKRNSRKRKRRMNKNSEEV